MSQSLAQSGQYFLVVERLGKPLLALLKGKLIALIPSNELFLFDLVERVHGVAQDFFFALLSALIQSGLEPLSDIGGDFVCHDSSLPQPADGTKQAMSEARLRRGTGDVDAF